MSINQAPPHRWTARAPSYPRTSSIKFSDRRSIACSTSWATHEAWVRFMRCLMMAPMESQSREGTLPSPCAKRPPSVSQERLVNVSSSTDIVQLETWILCITLRCTKWKTSQRLRMKNFPSFFWKNFPSFEKLSPLAFSNRTSSRFH